jgi:hypothetical protein
MGKEHDIIEAFQEQMTAIRAALKSFNVEFTKMDSWADVDECHTSTLEALELLEKEISSTSAEDMIDWEWVAVSPGVLYTPKTK